MLSGVDFHDNTPWVLRLVQNNPPVQFKQVLSTPAIVVHKSLFVAISFLWPPSWHRNLRKARARARARLRFSVPEEFCPQQSSLDLRAVFRLRHHHSSAPPMTYSS